MDQLETAEMRKVLILVARVVVAGGWVDVDDGEELEEAVVVYTDAERAEEKLA